MKPLAAYKNLAEILAEPVSPAEFHTKGQVIEAWKLVHPDQPPAPPEPTAADRIQLSQIRAGLLALKDNLLTLAAKESQFRERLPNVQSTLADLERNVNPDGPREALLDIAAERIRLQLLQEFVASAPGRKELLGRQLSGLLGRLTHLLEPLTGEQFFLNGSRAELNADTALAAIQRLSKQP